jgi:glycosyltransferase involved in cell wall biosynthesis
MDPAGTARSIVCVGFAEWDAELWTNQQHLMSRLAARGHRVLFVESLGLRRPQLAGRDVRRILRRLRRGLAPPRVRDGVMVLSPLVLPFHAFGPVRAVNARLLPALVRRAVRRAGLSDPVLWAYVPQAESLLPTLQPRTVVYHCVDDIAEQKGIDGPSFRAAEARFVDRADLVLASAPALAARLGERARRVEYAPNVADTDLFASALQDGPVDEEVAALPGPRIVFTGAVVATKLDLDLLTGIARRRPDWSVVLVGPVGLGDPGTDVSALAAEPNVHLLGGRPYSRLPEVLRAAHAAVIPYAVNELTRSVFPMKVYEYLAAGLPVVATPLPSLADVGSDVAVAEDADAFVEALDKAMATDDDASRRERSARARSHSWDTRLQEIEDALADVEQAQQRTVVATPYTPTLDSGARRRTHAVLTALAALGPVDVVYQETGGEPAPAYRADPAIRLHPVRGSRGLRRALAYVRARLAGVPRGFAKGIWPELADRVRQLDDGSCRVVADGPIAAAALRSLAARRPVVYNAHNLESAFRPALGDPDMGSARALRRFERTLLRESAESWLVSRADVTGAARIAPGSALRLVPNAVDVRAIRPVPPTGARTALFVGDFSYEPNRRALRFLVREVAPALAARDADVRIVVAGRGSETFDSRHPLVELCGFVPDLRPLYEAAGCVVVPLREGGGSPLKFVEALAHGLPVVATPHAAAGLDALDPDTDFLLVSPTGSAVALGILDALTPEAAATGAAGRRAAEEHYSVEALVRRFRS